MNAGSVLSIIRRRGDALRIGRMQEFFRAVRPSPTDVILDVGGLPDIWLRCGHRGKVVFLNLFEPEAFPPIPPHWEYVKGDGREIEFPDNSFDVVFSNSVIEHVGGWEDQRAFARETSRVGRKLWIQTPNRNFPLEPHWNFPLFQFLPLAARDRVAELWPFSTYMVEDGHPGPEFLHRLVRRIRLLDAGEMRELYPGGRIWKERVLGLAKSLVVLRG